MSKFKIGDLVKSNGEVNYSIGSTIVKIDWIDKHGDYFTSKDSCFPDYNYDVRNFELVKAASNCKCSCVEDKPVMCACVAKEILEAQGYTVSEPKTGKVYVSEPLNGGEIFHSTHKLNTKIYRTLAVLDWKQGEGL